MRREFRNQGWVVWCALVAAPLVAQAEDTTELLMRPHIVVQGQGTATAQPTSVEIELTASGEGELTGDAIAKFRSSVKQIAQSAKELGIDKLEVRQGGFSIGASGGGNAEQMFGVGNANQAAAKPQMAISRSITLVLKDVGEMPEDQLLDTIGKIIDTAKDAGATLGSGGGGSGMMGNVMRAMFSGGGGGGGAVTFVVEDSKSAREAAYQQAYAEAKATADALAALANRKVLMVHSIADSSGAAQLDADTQAQMQMVQNMLGSGGGGGGATNSRLTSPNFAPLAVNVSLQVTFRLTGG